MIEILPFDKELLKNFVYNGVEREITGEQILPIIEFYANLGTVYIGVIDGKVLGVGGVYPLWKNAGSAFLFLNKEAINYKKSIFKVLVQYTNELIKKYEIKTLMVECIDNIQARTLITHLGFIKNKEIKMAMYVKRGD